MSDDPMAWPDDAPPPDRLTHPTGSDTAFSVACAGCMWLAPIIGPLVLRLFLRDRPFALHWFRVSLIVQLVYVGLFVLGAFLTRLPSVPTTITTAIQLFAYGWALYASIFSLLKILRGKAETIPPVPASLLVRG